MSHIYQLLEAGKIFRLSESTLQNISSKDILILSVDSDVCFYPEQQINLANVSERTKL